MVTDDRIAIKSRRNAFLLGTAAAFLLLAAVAIPLCVEQFLSRLSEMFSDRAALWNTADALQMHVISEKEWPKDWDCLKPSLRVLDEVLYGDGDISFLTQRVDINFAAKTSSPLPGDDWYVRLRSRKMQSEQQAANDRLCDLLTWAVRRKKANDDVTGQ